MNLIRRKRNLTFFVLLFLLIVSWSGFAGAESTFDRIKQTGTLRIAGLVGEEPYFHKDIASGEWSGFCIEMARDIAKQLGAKLQIVESTWGNSVLDLQAGKIDISFGLNPTPQRALAIDFSRPLFRNSFGIVTRKGFEAKSWEDLNKPGVRIAVDLGSAHEAIARRYAPQAQIIGLKTRDEVIMTVQANRADCLVCTVFLGMSALKKNPQLGKYIIPQPVLSLPVSAGVRREDDKTFRDFISVWADYNLGLGATRELIINALGLMDIKPSDVPPEVQF